MSLNIFFASIVLTIISCSFLIVFTIYKQNRVLKNLLKLTSLIAKTTNIKENIEKLKQENIDVAEEIKLNSVIFYSTKEPICILNKDFKITSVNPAFENILGLNLEKIKGNTIECINTGIQDEDYYKKFYTISSSKESSSFQMWVRGSDGEASYHLVKVTKVLEDNLIDVKQYILIFSDITDIKENELKISEKSKHDHLTGLPNRSLFIDRLDRSVAFSKRNDIVGAVMFLDLDHFKSLNDTLGHRIGDLLLIEIAKRLKSCVRETDTVCRLAGDEFTIILPEIARSEDAAIVAEKIINSIVQEYNLEGNKIKNSCSLGIAVFPNDGSNVDLLIHAADQAMYNAKKEGRNQYKFYSSSLDIEAHRKKQIEKELVNATKENQFYLEYLPAYKIDNSISHYDVLIRWKHPTLGDIKPNEFIPLAEESRLIMEITDWIIKKSFKDLKGLLYKFKEKNIKLSFKLSSVHFKQNDIVERIVNLVGEDFINIVQIKIDEPIISKNLVEAKEKISKLLEKGFFICIDDFGTGKISFLDILDLKFNAVKIPRELTKNINYNEDYYAAVRSLISLAKNLDSYITIEGIENSEQNDKIEKYRDDKVFMQGHYYSKPLGLKDLKNNI